MDNQNNNNQDINIEIIDSSANVSTNTNGNVVNNNNNNLTPNYNNVRKGGLNLKTLIIVIVLVIVIGFLIYTKFILPATIQKKVINNAQMNTFKSEVQSFAMYLDSVYSDYQLNILKTDNTEDFCINENNSIVTVCSTVKGLVDNNYIKKSNISNWSGYVKMTLDQSTKKYTAIYNIEDGNFLATTGENNLVEAQESKGKISEKCSCN